MQKISIEYPTVKYNIEKCQNRQTTKGVSVVRPIVAQLQAQDATHI